MESIDKKQISHPDPHIQVQERLFCYELYHQMRKAVNDKVFDIHPLQIQSELNKAGQGCPAIPDFLFHIPGDNSNNNTVVEVKRASSWIYDLKKDLSKIAWFASNSGYKYKHGVFILIGDTERLNRCIKLFDKYQNEGKGFSITVLIFDCKENRIVRTEVYATESKWVEDLEKRKARRRNRA